ncbi:MAG: hypothetical protein WD081_01795 [Gammaproteobacteria bacterium]
MKTFITLVRREHWESSAFWIVPGVFGALLLFGGLFGIFSLWQHGVDPEDVRYGLDQLTSLATDERRELMKIALLSLAAPFNVFLVGVTFFYALDALYADRRDRSVLFFKSLPISDVQTVLSKLAMALLVGPALTLAVVAVFQIAAVLFGTGIMLWSGTEGWYLALDPVAMVYAWSTMAWALFAQSLVYLPIVAWLMLASAWARKAPFLWAVVPPVAVLIIEGWIRRFDGETALGNWLADRVSNALPLSFNLRHDGDGLRIGHVDGAFNANGGIDVKFDLLWSGLVWEGVAIAAVLLAGAVWLRRYRADAE